MEKEVLELIAKRKKPGDQWVLVGAYDKIYPSLTEALEAYYQSTQLRCDFRLSPLKGEIYIIKKEEVEEKKEEPKKFNIYGD